MEHSKTSKSLIHNIKTRPLVFVLILTLCISAASLYLYLTPLLYHTEVVIQKPADPSPSTQVNLFAPGNSAITEEITSVDFVREAMISEPALLVQHYIKSDFRTEPTAYRSPYQINYRVVGNPSFESQRYIIEPVNERVYKLTSSSNGVQRVMQGKFGEELSDNNIALTITTKIGKPVPEPFLFAPPQYLFTIESAQTLAKNLITDRALQVTDQNGIVTIACTANHPDKAYQIVNAITKHYLGGEAHENLTEITNSHISQLDQKLQTIAEQMATTEQHVAEYKKLNHITDLTIDTETSLEVMKELQMQKTNLEVKMATLDNLSTYLRKHRDGNNSLVEYGTIDDPEFVSQITRLNALYQKGETASLQQEVELLKASISERILNTRKKTAIQIEGLTLAIQNNQKHLSAIPEKATALMALDRKLQLDKRVYDLLSDKRAEAIVNNNLIATGARIVRPASIPTTPVAPVLWVVALLTILASIVIAWPLAYLINRIRENRIQAQKPISESTTIPMLGNIQLNTSNPVAIQSSFQELCTRIMMMKNIKTITITSAASGTGKSTTACGLGRTFAAMGKKVIIIDMNLKNPEIATAFGITPEHTLADTLDEICEISQSVCPTPFPNLDILSAGNLPMGINSWLSASQRENIMQQFEYQYDYILFDTPGTSGRVDALPFIRTGSLTLFVMKEGSSRTESFGMAEELCKTLQVENIFGVVNSTTPITRRIKYQQNVREEHNKMDGHSFLKRVALWFY